MLNIQKDLALPNYAQNDVIRDHSSGLSNKLVMRAVTLGATFPLRAGFNYALAILGKQFTLRPVTIPDSVCCGEVRR